MIEKECKMESGFRRNKRGGGISTKQWFLMFAIFMAVLVSMTIYQRDIKGLIEGKTFEKNYLARDIALTLDSIYAAPGDVKFNYDMGELEFIVILGTQNPDVEDDRDEKAKIIAQNNRITLKDAGPGISVYYPYAVDAKFEDIPRTTLVSPASIVFTKTTNKIVVRRSE